MSGSTRRRGRTHARIAIPKAEPSVYIGAALAVTFPFNVIVGIPLYLAAAQAVWGQ